MESQERVCWIAGLARLDLGQDIPSGEADAKLATFASQFDDIVALMDTLSEVDTDGVTPLYWPVSAPPAPPREDVALRHNSRADVLQNAPEQDGQFYVVPRIV